LPWQSGIAVLNNLFTVPVTPSLEKPNFWRSLRRVDTEEEEKSTIIEFKEEINIPK
jgi:hypothetical protein